MVGTKYLIDLSDPEATRGRKVVRVSDYLVRVSKALVLTPEGREYLRREWPREERKVISRRMGVSEDTVRRMARALGAEKPADYNRRHRVRKGHRISEGLRRSFEAGNQVYKAKRTWTDGELNELRTWYSTGSNADLCRRIGVSLPTMIAKARELGLKKDRAWLRARISVLVRNAKRRAKEGAER